jgi:hypothetical protein
LQVTVVLQLNKFESVALFFVYSDGDYVIVIGGLKSFQGKRQVVAYSVR